MRGGSGIDVIVSDGGPARPLRVLVGLLLALALLAGSGIGRQVAWAQGSGGNAGADATAVDDEEDRGIDLPFTSRDDDESGGDVDEDGPAFALTAYVCTPGDDSELLDRINYQIENWTTVDPEEGITLDELHDACEPSAGEITFTVTDLDTNETEEKTLGGEEDDYVTWDIEANVGYAVDADEPDGYGEPIVFCAFHESDEPAEDLSPSPMTDGVLYFGMGAGTTYTCDWFHVDLGDPAARGGGEIASAVLDRGGELEPGHTA